MDSGALRRKIHACWLGKAIGGTLGTPHEGKPGPLALSFYDPVPTRALPNDDLDLQIVWLHFLRARGARSVTPQLLAEAWQEHVLFPFDEYGVARRNRAWGLQGAAQGATDNYFGECMGGAIRSELWACLAPGDPTRAAGFAWADAVVDHCGEGVWAEVFHAALQSAAFVEPDRDKLLALALGFLPEDSRLKRALRDTIAWWRETPDWRVVRQKAIDRYYPGNFTDVVCNLCFELIGWFDGAGDFGRSICTAVNCGQDTDCTGATLGALMGIIDPDCIPERWRRPIGEEIVLSDAIVGLQAPRTLAELTRWTLEASQQLAGFAPRVGEVRPRQTANGCGPGIVIEAANLPGPLRLDHPSPPEPTSAYAPITRGFWSRWRPEDFRTPAKVLRLAFNLERPAAVKLMLYYGPGAAAWIDGRRILAISEREIRANPFLAPSFHRADSASAVVPALASGPHELLIALAPPAPGGESDLVFGLGDPATNLWLPHAIAPQVGAAAQA